MAGTPGYYEQLGAQTEAPQLLMNPLHQQPVPRAAKRPRDKHKSALYGLGFVEIVLGTISIFLAVVTLIIAGMPYHWYGARSLTYPSQGLWGGLMLIVNGFLGVKAKVNPSVCVYKANMVMSIITANIAGVVVILSGIASAYCAYEDGSLATIHALLCVLAFAAFVICIIHSAYCCDGVCCRIKPYQYVATYIPPMQQMVQLSNGQFVMVPYQPMVPSNYTGYPTGAIGSPVIFQPNEIGAVASPTTLPTQVPMSYSGAVPTQQTAGNDQEIVDNPPSYTA